jgi:hypothetical protein
MSELKFGQVDLENKFAPFSKNLFVKPGKNYH